MRFGPSQLSCLGSSVGRALCLEYRVSWVRVPPEAAHFFLGKVTALGVLCCFALFVCLTLLASFFLPSHLSFKNMYLQEGVGVAPGSAVSWQGVSPPGLSVLKDTRHTHHDGADIPQVQVKNAMSRQ